MSTVTYSLSQDFQNGIKLTLFQQQIEDDPDITTTLIRVDVIGDDVDVVFVSSLSSSEQTVLDLIVANHVPPDHVDFVYKGSFIPFETDTYNLGSTTNFWDNVYGKSVLVDDSNFNLRLLTNRYSTIAFNGNNNSMSYDRDTDELLFSINNTEIIKFTDTNLQVDNISPFTNKTSIDGVCIFNRNTTSYGIGSVTNTLSSLTTGGSNIGIGSGTLNSITTASGCVGIGTNSLSNNTSSNITAMGLNALRDNTTGTSLSAFGRHALIANTIGINNSAFGYDSLSSNTEGINNSAYGRESLRNLLTGNRNTGFGSTVGQTLVTGSENTLYGSTANVSDSDAIERGAFGYNAVAVNDYDMQMGQSGTNTTTGKFIYREQILGDESWKSLTENKGAIIDSSGNLTYDTNESSDNYTSTFDVDTVSSSGNVTIKCRRYRDKVFISIEAWQYNGFPGGSTGVPIFQTNIDAVYRPPQTVIQPILIQNGGGPEQGYLKVDTSGVISVLSSQLGFLDYTGNVGTGINSATNISYIV